MRARCIFKVIFFSFFFFACFEHEPGGLEDVPKHEDRVVAGRRNLLRPKFIYRSVGRVAVTAPWPVSGDALPSPVRRAGATTERQRKNMKKK